MLVHTCYVKCYNTFQANTNVTLLNKSPGPFFIDEPTRISQLERATYIFVKVSELSCKVI